MRSARPLRDTARPIVSTPIQDVVERVRGAKDDEEEEEEDEDTPKEKFVFLARSGKAELTRVQTGISDATDVAIVSGVKTGDPVVTGPFRTLRRLKDGAAIEVVKEDKTVTTDKKKS